MHAVLACVFLGLSSACCVSASRVLRLSRSESRAYVCTDSLPVHAILAAVLLCPSGAFGVSISRVLRLSCSEIRVCVFTDGLFVLTDRLFMLFVRLSASVCLAYFASKSQVFSVSRTQRFVHVCAQYTSHALYHVPCVSVTIVRSMYVSYLPCWSVRVRVSAQSS